MVSEETCESGKSIPSGGNSRSKDAKVEKPLWYLGDCQVQLHYRVQRVTWDGRLVKTNQHSELKQPSFKCVMCPSGTGDMRVNTVGCGLGRLLGEDTGRGWGSCGWAESLSSSSYLASVSP